jgi:hypothetical protein
MLGDRLPQRGDPEGVGIADRLAGEGLSRRFEHRLGCETAGLTDLEMDDFATGGLAFVGGAQDVHGDEGRDQAAAGWT